jgi:hypothetical protein
MSGTAKWILVGSAVVIAITALIFLGVFAWMMFGGSWMSAANPSWVMPHSNGNPAWMDSGSGMMGNFGSGSPGMMGFRDYEGAGFGGALVGDDFTFEVVEERLDDFLGGREDLAIAEIMIFSNHAYAQIVETESGIGAMEVLVDPITLAVTPEHGPNMMWNQKYGGMHGGRMMGLGMGFGSPQDIQGEMPISPEEAIEIAQKYLDQYATGMTADEHADAFYGYYTIHTLRDGDVVGMLSVHGSSGQIFPHTWHGEMLAMSADVHQE